KKLKAVIYGAGNIGRGFIAQLLYKSGYETVFLDIDSNTIDRINKDKSYPICIVSDDGIEKTYVKNVRAVNSNDTESAVKEIYSADIMATSVGAGVLKYIAQTVAMAIEKRIKDNLLPLNIMLCENLNYADKIFKQLLFKYLSEDAIKVFDKNVGLIEASIGRMVPVFEKSGAENPLTVYVEPFDILHLDKDGFVGEIPQIKNVVTYSPFKYFMQRKLFIHNMCHAFCAYLGAVKGYNYISEAISDSDIKYLVSMAGTSAAQAITLDNKEDLVLLLHFLYKLLYRFNNRNLKDTVARVGKDPLRKLNADDRLIGAYKLCKKHGVNTVYIIISIAAALHFKDIKDSKWQQIQSELESRGISYTLYTICGSVIEQNDIKLIIEYYNLIKCGDFKKVINLSEKILGESIKNY
ncbi:MAG: hypothetical protein PHE12_04870, partial [Clostridia bacterium]|nr:hypothetical protein [Clostridia bacterium]